METNILVFDWQGMIAHFRQFDANSSSLSHAFPPPTAIAGMLAGILGYPRDSYYQQFNRENLQMAIQIKTPPRKMIHNMNYIFAKGPKELNMSGKNMHTQIPLELLVAPDFPESPLIYRIFLQLADRSIFQKLSRIILKRRFHYLPYLGSASFSSWMEWVGIPESIEIFQPAEPVTVDSIVPTHAVRPQSLCLESHSSEPFSPAYFREQVRREFLPKREPGEMLNILWERNAGKIKARFSCPVHRLKLNNETIQLIFI